MAEDLRLLRKSIGKDEWTQIANISGTTAAYLDQIALGFRKPSAALAEKIENAISALHPGSGVTKEALVFTSIRPRKNKRCSAEARHD